MAKQTPETNLNTEIMSLLKTAKLSTAERSDLYALTGSMAEDDNELDQNDFLYMYLSGDRDWKKDFKTMFNREAGKSSSKKFDISKADKVVVKKPKA